MNFFTRPALLISPSVSLSRRRKRRDGRGLTILIVPMINVRSVSHDDSLTSFSSRRISLVRVEERE